MTKDKELRDYKKLCKTLYDVLLDLDIELSMVESDMKDNIAYCKKEYNSKSTKKEDWYNQINAARKKARQLVKDTRGEIAGSVQAERLDGFGE